MRDAFFENYFKFTQKITLFDTSEKFNKNQRIKIGVRSVKSGKL